MSIFLPNHITPITQLGGAGRSVYEFDTPVAIGAASWQANNRAIYMPFTLPDYATVARFQYLNGNNVGNIDLGIYDAASYTRIISTGSTAKGTATTCVFIGVTDIVLPPGDYYMGVVVSSTGGSLQRLAFAADVGDQVGMCRICGLLQEDLGATTLPTTMTPVAVAQNYVPIIGFSQSDTL